MKPLSDKEHLNCARPFANKLQIARASVTHLVCIVRLHHLRKLLQ